MAVGESDGGCCGSRMTQKAMSTAFDLFRDVLAFGAKWSGLSAGVRMCSPCGLLVVCYHSVLPEIPTDDTGRFRHAVCVPRFREQMEFLSSRFHVIPPRQCLDAIQRERRLPRGSALITFDDGYKNNIVYAAPELSRMGIPALFAVSTGYVGGRQLLWTQEVFERVMQWGGPAIAVPWSKGEVPVSRCSRNRSALAHRIRRYCKSIGQHELCDYLGRIRGGGGLVVDGGLEELYAFMDWSDVKSLVRRGFDVASHTVSHPILARMEPCQIREELCESKAAIERHTGSTCSCICYPNGESQDVTPRVLELAAEVGYELGFTTSSCANRTDVDPLAIGRIGTSSHQSMPVFEWRASALGAFSRGLECRREMRDSRSGRG